MELHAQPCGEVYERTRTAQGGLEAREGDKERRDIEAILPQVHADRVIRRGGAVIE